jgi:tetratricopeptide (TPR) repeat protein
MQRCVSVLVLCLIARAVFAMGSAGGSGTGTGTAGGGSTGGPDSNTVQRGIRPAIILYRQGIGLMHAKKFAEAQAKFEQAIAENPNFAESHNYLGYSLQMEGPQHYSVASNTIIKPFNSSRISRKRTNIVACFF